MQIMFMLILKTPLGHSIKPVERALVRLDKINNFDAEIEALNLDIDTYDYILIDDYHGSEVAYYFQKSDNVLVLSNARFSNFNIWRHQDLNIALESPLRSLPSLGKCIYIGTDYAHYKELSKLFGNEKLLSKMQKKIVGKELTYYFVEFNN